MATPLHPAMAGLQRESLLPASSRRQRRRRLFKVPLVTICWTCPTCTRRCRARRQRTLQRRCTARLLRGSAQPAAAGASPQARHRRRSYLSYRRLLKQAAAQRQPHRSTQRPAPLSTGQRAALAALQAPNQAPRCRPGCGPSSPSRPRRLQSHRRQQLPHLARCRARCLQMPPVAGLLRHPIKSRPFLA